MKTKRKKIPTLSVETAEEILSLVFMDGGEEKDTPPLEELTSYSLYRRESFRLQMYILLVALVLFALLPSLFVRPVCETSFSPKGERGLPVYSIKVDTMLPVKSVTAVLDNYRLPVYEVNGHEYTIEPTKNGNVELTVELFNGQSVSQKLDVMNADVTHPRLLSYAVGNDSYELYLSDDGVGVDYESIYAETSAGDIIYPESYNRQTGLVTFGADAVETQVYIPDYFENTLKIKLF
jgi:hypothetical protein